MTENADVKWLRVISDFGQEWLTKDRARRLLAHIDQLEAEVKMLREVEAECGRQLDRRPTLHEIAALVFPHFIVWEERSNTKYQDDAEAAYTAAEALEAEGRRRDGNG